MRNKNCLKYDFEVCSTREWLRWRSRTLRKYCLFENARHTHIHIVFGKCKRVITRLPNKHQLVKSRVTRAWWGAGRMIGHTCGVCMQRRRRRRDKWTSNPLCWSRDAQRATWYTSLDMQSACDESAYPALAWNLRRRCQEWRHFNSDIFIPHGIMVREILLSSPFSPSSPFLSLLSFLARTRAAFIYDYNRK